MIVMMIMTVGIVLLAAGAIVSVETTNFTRISTVLLGSVSGLLLLLSGVILVSQVWDTITTGAPHTLRHFDKDNILQYAQSFGGMIVMIVGAWHAVNWARVPTKHHELIFRSITYIIIGLINTAIGLLIL